MGRDRWRECGALDVSVFLCVCVFLRKFEIKRTGLWDSFDKPSVFMPGES